MTITECVVPRPLRDRAIVDTLAQGYSGEPFPSPGYSLLNGRLQQQCATAAFTVPASYPLPARLIF